eukprot:15353540-Ditylum_brightwellii.AAC.1
MFDHFLFVLGHLNSGSLDRLSLDRALVVDAHGVHGRNGVVTASQTNFSRRGGRRSGFGLRRSRLRRRTN